MQIEARCLMFPRGLGRIVLVPRASAFQRDGPQSGP